MRRRAATGTKVYKMEKAAASARASNPVMAYLEVTGAAKPTVFPLHEEAVIGRERQDSLGAGAFLCIPDHTISRRHARVMRRDGTYFIEDLHSYNGTFVLGNRLPPGEWHPLRDGDELMISSVQVVFHSLVAPPRESTPTIIARTVDATQWAMPLDIGADALQGDMRRSVQKLHAMAQVGIALGAVTDREMLIEKIMSFIFDLFPLAERAFILLRGPDGGEPLPVAARRRDGVALELDRVRLSRTIVDEVVNRKQSILSVDTLADRHFGSQESIVSQAIRSVMCVPLILEGDSLGLIQVDTSSDPYAFKEADLEVLTGVCAETAVALKNFQLYSDIERLLDGFVSASVQAIEERDPVTAGHSFRVADYALSLAKAADRVRDGALRKVAFSRDQLREIRYAALLHDFGKVGVREHVLRKEKKLHHAEMLLLEQRFKYARACLERKAYRDLVEAHCARDMPIADFRAERQRIDIWLQEEFARLDGFMETIRHANEPAIMHSEGLPGLRDAMTYSCAEDEAQDFHLLSEGEFAALSVARGCLSADERRQIEMHVADSYSFLILIPWTRDLAGVPAIAHGHHEKLDGSGYPLGLQGEQIGMQTRILTICDIYDALTASDRPYKKALPLADALDLMDLECRAGKLDAALFRAFVDSKAWLATDHDI
jgi:3',5'-cyclic-nucleotide phosphodiesterase